MPLFIKISMWLSLFSVAMKLVALSIAPYPRTVKYDRWEDSLAIAGSLAFAFWAFLIVYR